ncbi:hypothetical protein BDQ17DRAFT_1359742 [Cyathus striatus]|nr:hypothetical protein BDQ17DRAFT_1359742 [Cyathus striatus]
MYIIYELLTTAPAFISSYQTRFIKPATSLMMYSLNFHINSDRHKDRAFEILQREIVAGATHNSGECYDAPKCHPETRKAVLSNIMSWVDSNKSSNSRIMWLHGAAGAGKSDIAQTTAEESHRERKLVASFFFSQSSVRRSNKDGLVATIAFQLCMSVPAVKNHIIRSIEENPGIFKSDIFRQMQVLVIKPFNNVKPEDGATPRLIIIDGLDQCLNRKDQAEIIKAIAKSLLMDNSSRLRVLLTSRPEAEIRQAFNENSVSSLCTPLALIHTFDPDDDIYLYLRSHFETLRRQHISPLSKHWPSDEAIRQIVKKSSGQFIYASTVIQYISEPRHDPRKRLYTILNSSPSNGETLFSQGDEYPSSQYPGDELPFQDMDDGYSSSRDPGNEYSPSQDTDDVNPPSPDTGDEYPSQDIDNEYSSSHEFRDDSIPSTNRWSNIEEIISGNFDGSGGILANAHDFSIYNSPFTDRSINIRGDMVNVGSGYPLIAGGMLSYIGHSAFLRFWLDCAAQTETIESNTKLQVGLSKDGSASLAVTYRSEVRHIIEYSGRPGCTAVSDMTTSSEVQSWLLAMYSKNIKNLASPKSLVLWGIIFTALMHHGFSFSGSRST